MKKNGCFFLYENLSEFCAECPCAREVLFSSCSFQLQSQLAPVNRPSGISSGPAPPLSSPPASIFCRSILQLQRLAPNLQLQYRRRSKQQCSQALPSPASGLQPPTPVRRSALSTQGPVGSPSQAPSHQRRAPSPCARHPGTSAQPPAPSAPAPSAQPQPHPASRPAPSHQRPAPSAQSAQPPAPSGPAPTPSHQRSAPGPRLAQPQHPEPSTQPPVLGHQRGKNVSPPLFLFVPRNCGLGTPERQER